MARPRTSSPPRASSARALVILAGGILLWSLGAHAETASRRLAVVIGNNVGLGSEVPLKYAEQEATALSKTLMELGDVRPHDMYVLLQKQAPEVRRILDQVARRAQEMGKQGDVVLLFYYSGHGARSALHLGPTRLTHDELRRRLGSARARTVIALVDACHSGAILRQKGFERRPSFKIRLDHQRAVRGQVFITSSADHEVSLEIESLRGSLFSHYLISGLRGAADRNRDGRVELNELYRYTYQRTLLRSVASTAGAQHPAFDLDLKGSGQVVLTWPRRSDTKLTFGPRLDGTYYVVARHDRQVMVELTKRAGVARSIALPPRSYVIKKPVKGGYLVGAVNLTWGGEQKLSEADMSLVSLEAAARKGVVATLAPNEILVAADLRTGVVAGNPFLAGARAAYRRVITGSLVVGGGLAFHQGSLDAEELSLITRSLSAELVGRYRLTRGSVLLGLGGVIGAGLTWQVIPGHENRHSLAFTGGVLGEVSWIVAEPLLLSLQVRGGLEVARIYESYEARALLGLGIGVGVRW